MRMFGVSKWGNRVRKVEKYNTLSIRDEKKKKDAGRSDAKSILSIR